MVVGTFEQEAVVVESRAADGTFQSVMSGVIADWGFRRQGGAMTVGLHWRDAGWENNETNRCQGRHRARSLVLPYHALSRLQLGKEDNKQRGAYRKCYDTCLT